MHMHMYIRMHMHTRMHALPRLHTKLPDVHGPLHETALITTHIYSRVARGYRIQVQ